jgi:hypothetical protein
MGADSIFVRKVGTNEPWSTPEASTYENESALQALLAENPSRITGVDEGSLAVRELQTSAGPIDICVVSPQGEITVVECKLHRNSEPRRMVLGQVMDYASALHADGLEAFHAAWKSRGGLVLDQYLEPDGLESLSLNIREGRFHLAVAVDQIDDDLRRLIEYLNVVTRDDVRVTALELSYSRHGDVEILIPSSFGAELARSKSSNSQTHLHWTWDEFVESLPSPQDQELAQMLYARLLETPNTGPFERLWCGRRPNGGIFFQIYGERFSPFQLWRSKAGKLKVFGNWTVWPSLEFAPKFAQLADTLGQSHLDGARSVPLDSINLDEFWNAALDCARALNPLTETS